MKKSAFKVVSIILISVFGIFVIYISLPFTTLFVHSVIEGLNHDSSQEPKPQITYGEFSVELTYTVDNQTIETVDIYVCEYAGYTEAINLRRWDGYMKSTKKVGFVLYDEKDTKIFCKIGDPSYYMGDSKEAPYPIIIKDTGALSGMITQEELFEDYGIKLVEWKTSPPIKNSFEEFE